MSRLEETGSKRYGRIRRERHRVPCNTLPDRRRQWQGRSFAAGKCVRTLPPQELILPPMGTATDSNGLLKMAHWESNPTQPLVLKLDQSKLLNQNDREILTDIAQATRDVPAGTDIISDGERPERVHLVTEGIACRYKILENGSRSIMAFLLPGDFCDLHVAVLTHMDHTIGTLTPCKVVDIPRSKIEELVETEPRITRMFWWATLVDEAILREWLAFIGRRPAEIRLAHLFCELQARMETVELSDGHSFSLPLTQQVLADAVGLSTVHLNRAIQSLRTRGLIRTVAGRIGIPDRDALWSYAEFDPGYLHLHRFTGNRTEVRRGRERLS